MFRSRLSFLQHAPHTQSSSAVIHVILLFVAFNRFPDLSSDISSIGPSQSASQIYLPVSSLSVPTDQPTLTPPRVASPDPFPPRSSSPRPLLPPSSSFTLQIPPAHSISEFALPSTIQKRTSEELEDPDRGSSEEDSRPVEVVENARFATTATTSTTTNANRPRRFSLRNPRSRDNSGSNTTSSGTGTAVVHERKSSGGFFSSIAGLFRGGGNIGSTHSGADKWRMRTETNLKAVRRDIDSDSEGGSFTESPSRRLFGRHVLHDTPPPPSPVPAQKLKKRSTRQREKEGGWISDGAVVAGRGARKASVKNSSALTSTSSVTVSPSVPTSTHSRSSTATPVPSFAPGPTLSTPPHAKPYSKPKTDLRIEALSRSSSTDVSRQSTLRSSGSVTPTPRRSSTGQRTPSLPSSQFTPPSTVGRNSSLMHHKKTKSLAYASIPSPPSHADAGRAGYGQMSLMAIVDGVTRDNRAGWERANAGLPPEFDSGTGTVSGLVSVRAPPPMSKYNLRGEGGQGIAYETVLAPGSVFPRHTPHLQRVQGRHAHHHSRLHLASRRW
ncbi:hypothetical protein B0F90DRAFT_393098 [Multifurca ochricompacta]|uniref:Uncharacterized protein n=1 Tax=Multifurca ochricompacta TaxID=376703 RepID=A0AAD4QKT5_9AGAM|nr:hypothetical protein B0F90DRAFT_393098 [Multifurca ochricompacta]